MIIFNEETDDKSSDESTLLGNMFMSQDQWFFQKHRLAESQIPGKIITEHDIFVTKTVVSLSFPPTWKVDARGPESEGFKWSSKQNNSTAVRQSCFHDPCTPRKNLAAISGSQTGYIHVAFRKSGSHRFGLFNHIWLVVWNRIFIFPYIGNSNPNWLIFFRGVETTNQPYNYYFALYNVALFVSSALRPSNDGFWYGNNIFFPIYQWLHQVISSILFFLSLHFHSEYHSEHIHAY